MNTVKSQTYTYDHPRLNYTEEQSTLLGLSEDRFEKDNEMPSSVTLGGIKPVTLAVWKKGFNPVKDATVLNVENPPSHLLFRNEPVFKPITELNRRKQATKDAILKYVQLLEGIGNEIMALKMGKELTDEGISKRSQDLAYKFIESALDGVLLTEFKKNSEVISAAWKTVSKPPNAPDSPVEAIIDVEIRTVYRDSEELRRSALIGKISPRHDLAITRGEAPISGFQDDDFDVLFLAAAVRKNIEESHQIEMLYAINSSLWLMAHRSITGIAEFSKFRADLKEDLLNVLGLNWHGQNLMSELDFARNFLETSVKQEENLNKAERLKIASDKVLKG